MEELSNITTFISVYGLAHLKMCFFIIISEKRHWVLKNISLVRTSIKSVKAFHISGYIILTWICMIQAWKE